MLSRASRRFFGFLQRYSTLTRSLDPALATHQVLAVIALASFSLGTIGGRGVGGGVTAGVAAVLGWALARELAPDDQFPAMAAGVGAGVFQALVGGVGLGVGWLVLVFLRILVRSVGAAPTTLDLVANLMVAVFVANTVPGLLAALGVALALFLSPILPRPSPTSHRAWGVAVGVLALVSFAFSPAPVESTATGAGWLLAALAGLGSVGLVAEPRPVSLGDLDGQPLDGARLRLARLELVALLLVIVVSTLGAGINSVAPALFAVLAAGISGIRSAAAP